jgi:bacterioferritin-associated ferredoxin
MKYPGYAAPGPESRSDSAIVDSRIGLVRRALLWYAVRGQTPQSESNMSRSAKVDRCLCSGLSFVEIQAAAKQMNTKSIKKLKHQLDMGPYCSACAPYVREMLKTGQTEFSHDPFADQLPG